MLELKRFTRRVMGRYVPFSEPYWDISEYDCVDGWLKGGEQSDAKEKLKALLLKKFPKAKEVVLANSGKSALAVVLRLLGVGSNSEIILPSFCCASVVAAVISARCTPVFVDSDCYGNIEYSSVLEALSLNTSAILVPHLFGREADSLTNLLDLGRNRNIFIIEDVTQAFGLRFSDGLLAGSRGDAAIFSCGMGKPIMGTGGGWAILNTKPFNELFELQVEPFQESLFRITNYLDRFYGKRSKRGRNEVLHSIRSRIKDFKHNQKKINLMEWSRSQCKVYDITDIEAWLTIKQIQKIDSNLSLREINASRWACLLDSLNFKNQFRMPGVAKNIYATYPLFFKGEQGLLFSQYLRHSFESMGVSTQPCYVPLHLRVYGNKFKKTRMNGLNNMWKGAFTLTTRPNLNEYDWAHIEECIAILHKKYDEKKY